LRRLAAAFLALAALPAYAQEADGAYARGALAWIFSDDLDLIGSMSAEVPFADAGGWRVYAGARADTAIAKASDFTFQVEAVSYTAGFGARRRLAPGHGAIEFSVFERGRQNVDAPGRARVRAAGTAWSSDGWDDGFGPAGFSGRVAVGAVFEEDGVDGVATSEGGVRWIRRFGRSQAQAFGFDLTWDALLGDDSGVDLLAGPRLDFDLGGGRRFGLYARYLESGNPLGLDADGLLVGFDFGQGVLTSGGRPTPPELAGLVAAGVATAGAGSPGSICACSRRRFSADSTARSKWTAMCSAPTTRTICSIGTTSAWPTRSAPRGARAASSITAPITCSIRPTRR
jgi:hypothetical protein